MSTVLALDERDNLVGVIDQIFQQFPAELRGKKVLVKPNFVCAIPPGCCTNPQVIEAVVLAVLARGGQVTVGDGMRFSEQIGRRLGANRPPSRTKAATLTEQTGH